MHWHSCRMRACITGLRLLLLTTGCRTLERQKLALLSCMLCEALYSAARGLRTFHRDLHAAAASQQNVQLRQGHAALNLRYRSSLGVKSWAYTAWSARPAATCGKEVWQLPTSMAWLQSIMHLR